MVAAESRETREGAETRPERTQEYPQEAEYVNARRPVACPQKGGLRPAESTIRRSGAAGMLSPARMPKGSGFVL